MFEGSIKMFDNDENKEKTVHVFMPKVILEYNHGWVITKICSDDEKSYPIFYFDSFNVDTIDNNKDNNGTIYYMEDKDLKEGMNESE